MKQLRRKSDHVIKYTPMIPKTENGKTVLVKVGRPLTASNEHELRKKMQNRVSAIEARMRKKRKLEELEERVERLSSENERLRNENARLSCKAIDWDEKPVKLKPTEGNSSQKAPSGVNPYLLNPQKTKNEPSEQAVTPYPPYFNQPTYQSCSYYPSNFSTSLMSNSFYPPPAPPAYPLMNQPAQTPFSGANSDSLKNLLSTPQAPPVPMPSTSAALATTTTPPISYANYNPRPTYDNHQQQPDG